MLLVVGSSPLRRIISSSSLYSSKSATGILLLQLASVASVTTVRGPIPYSATKTIHSFGVVSKHSELTDKGCIKIEGTTRDYSGKGDSKTKEMAGKDLVKLDFEVYGRVQGVFFRKYTQDEAASLGLRGYCRNTSSGTVSGTLEGPRPQIERMKAWLRSTGSPMSRIEKAEFRNEENINTYSQRGAFGIERTI